MLVFAFFQVRWQLVVIQQCTLLCGQFWRPSWRAKSPAIESRLHVSVNLAAFLQVGWCSYAESPTVGVDARSRSTEQLSRARANLTASAIGWNNLR